MKVTLNLDVERMAKAVQDLMVEWTSEPDELESVVEEIITPIFYYDVTEEEEVVDEVYWDVHQAVADAVRRQGHVWRG